MTTMFLLNPSEVPPGRTALDLSSVTTLQAQMAALQTQAASLQSQTTSLQTQAGQTASSSLQAQATSLQGQVTTLQGQVATLQGQVATLQSQMAAAQTAITSNSNAISANATAIAANGSAIATLQSQVSVLQSQVSTLQTQVATLQSQVATLQTQMAAAQVAITKLQVHGLAQFNTTTASLNTNTSVATISGWAGSTANSNLWVGASLPAMISGSNLVAPLTGMYALNYYTVMTNTSAMTTSLTVNGVSFGRGTGVLNSTGGWTGVLQAGATITVNLSYTAVLLQTPAFTSAMLNMNLLFVF